MSDSFRSGNSRILARTLDQLGHPLAVLDRRGVVVFANEPLCAMAKADASQLVGKRVSWHIALDESPFASILTSLAPPAGSLQGKIISRQLSAPIVFGSTATGQLFLPLLDQEGGVQATVVVLGRWQEIVAQLPAVQSPSLERRRQTDTALVQIRSRWKTLDGLHALIGQSPAIELAMARAQLAIPQPCNVFVWGPKWVGKMELVQGLFGARLKNVGLQKIAGQLLPVACGVVDAEPLAGMLDVFSGRFRAHSPRAARLLLLEQFDKLAPASVSQLNQWLAVHGEECWVAAVSNCRADDLATRDASWQKLISRVAEIEINLPPLRERREDIPLLANHLLAAQCQQMDRATLTFAPDTLKLLTAFPWPENVAQLSQAIEEAVKQAVLVSAIQVSHLPTAVRTFASTADGSDRANVDPIDLDQVLLGLERIMLQRALKLSPRNRAHAARLLGISRPRLLRRIAQLGLDAAEE